MGSTTAATTGGEMRTGILITVLLLSCAWFAPLGTAQGVAPTPPQDADPVTHYPGDTPTPAPAPKATTKSDKGDLNTVLDKMDKNGAHFSGALADVELEQFTPGGKKKDVETGQVFVRRRKKNHEAELALWIEKPETKRAAFSNNQLTYFDGHSQHSLDIKQEDSEPLMKLGFGGQGHDLLTAYDVKLSGFEKIDGVDTARLELVGKSEKLRSLFSRVVLWIDPRHSVSLQQERLESSGEYQLAHYSNINLLSAVHEEKPVTLDMILAQMDAASASFRAAQADVELVQYTAVVREKDVQTGQIFFRRKNHDTQVALWIEKPHPKQAVVKDGKITFIDQRTKQVTERDLGANKHDVEAVMNLGFGGRGQDLLAEYDITLAGFEKIDGVDTARLELVAKSEKLRRMFTKLVLWIDPKRDVAVQQQRFESSGDYQLTHYTNIKMSSSIPDDKFVVKK